MTLKKLMILIIRGYVGSGKTELINKINKELKFEMIIIDDIKKMCGNMAFKKAGCRVNKLLKYGYNVVVEEAFLKKKYFDYFISEIENKERYNVKSILLNCTLEDAIFRKKDHNKSVIIHQFSIKPHSFFENELVINTSENLPSDVYSLAKEYIQ